MESHTGAAGAWDSKQKKQETGEDAGRDWVVASVVPGDSEGQPEEDKHKARGRSVCVSVCVCVGGDLDF